VPSSVKGGARQDPGMSYGLFNLVKFGCKSDKYMWDKYVGGSGGPGNGEKTTSASPVKLGLWLSLAIPTRLI
jgi:hypothetical protein